MTFWRFFTTRYTDHLETEVANLKSQLAQERQEVRRLTDALVPSLQRRIPVNMGLRVPDPVSESLKKVHHITKAEDQQSASCACGWKFEAMGTDEIVQLQQAISEHYKLAYPPTKAKRPTASERIRAEEEKSLKESQNQRTTA